MSTTDKGRRRATPAPTAWVTTLAPTTAAPTPAPTQATIPNLESNYLRFGGGLSSLESNGDLKQPFYYNTASENWMKLTYGSNRLFFIIYMGGDGSGTYNTNGEQVDLTLDAEVDTSDLYGIGDGRYVGTLRATQYIMTAQNDFEVTREYTMDGGEGSRAATIKVTVRALYGSLENVRVWIGTNDDWAGTTDGPHKQLGEPRSSPPYFTERGDAATVFVSTAEEHIYLTAVSPWNGRAVQSSCCSSDNVVNRNPDDSPTSATGDGSYGLFFPLGDVAQGEEKSVVAAYAAGENAYHGEVVMDLLSVVAAHTWSPTPAPTLEPSSAPTLEPSSAPSPLPTAVPTSAPLENVPLGGECSAHEECYEYSTNYDDNGMFLPTFCVYVYAYYYYDYDFSNLGGICYECTECLDPSDGVDGTCGPNCPVP
jgi:hypothetical protein